MALNVNATVGAFLTAVDSSLDTAMGTGVSGEAPIAAGAYGSVSDASLKTKVRDGFRLAFAAFLTNFAEAWQNVSSLGFANGWVASTPVPQYRREAGDLVRLRGAIASGSSGATAFTLPVGYRPTGTVRFPLMAGGAFGWTAINSDGTVNVVGSNSLMSLDGIVFSTS